MKGIVRSAGLTILLMSLTLLPVAPDATAAVMSDYCIQPPFVTQSVPPLVMFDVGRDHKLYYQAYDDASDLDEDGRLDFAYKHSIDYFGYFDPYKCYEFSGGASGGTNANSQFNPVSVTADKFCSSAGGQWSGNVLNWLTMTRMDVLKKVLYGGFRSGDSNNETILERVFLPQDAHSWGKELTGRICRYTGTADAAHPSYTRSCVVSSDCETGYSCTDMSNQLIGIPAADAPPGCSDAVTVGTVADKILYATYSHSSSLPSNVKLGNTHSDLMTSFDPSALLSYSAQSDFSASVFNPWSNHTENSNIIAVAEFQVSGTSGDANEQGTWQFAVDGDDGVEVAIFPAAVNTDGTVVASYYGGHSACIASGYDPNSKSFCNSSQSGSITLVSGWYRMVARETENTGSDGIKVWVKRKNDSIWKLFGTATFGTGNMRAPDITSSNVCSIQSNNFIQTGVPGVASNVTGKHHLFCNTSITSGGTPLLRLLKNMSNRIWEWASKERPVCDSSLGTPIDFAVRAKVCDPTVSGVTGDNLRNNESCKEYPATGSGNWKPIGLLQKYGEGDGSKVCSKTMAKSCNSDSDCDFTSEGLCIIKAKMYYGMMTTSYEKNLSGGVLRKNITSILDETNANNGIFQSSENVQGNIIHTLDRLKLVGYRYSDYSYQDSSGGSCGWITSRPLNEGECRNWGNPIAEMMYESFRYFAGKLTPTADFVYSGTQDSGLNLSKTTWGYKVGNTYYPLYSIYPACARPFILLLSDVNTSYDADQIPGSSFKKRDNTTFSEDTATPLLGLGDTAGGVSLLNSMAATIGATEGIIDQSWFIGENGSIQDFICTAKTASSFSLLRGMCPTEPTKQGGYYAAALAYFGKTKFQSKTGRPAVNTYAVALSSPFADLTIKAGSSFVTLVPLGKSVSGGLGVYDACAAKMSLSYDTTGHGLLIAPQTPAVAGAFCPTNQIVNFYVDDIRYDTDNSVIYAKFRINFEDVEQGADHDMDAIVSYEVCTQTATTNHYGTCNTTLNANQIEVKLFGEYAAGSIDQVLGFIISGTTDDGVFLPIRDKDVSSADSDTPAAVATMPTQWSRVFTVSPAGTTSKFLKNPLWYAAKWGGFEDRNGSGTADQQNEWDIDGDGDPDNYFLVTNPLKLNQQLDKALSAILAKVSSGTAASILSNAEGTGAVLLQAIFYPQRVFSEQTQASWIGELHNLWYYIDPYISKSSMREDTDYTDTTGAAPHKLDLKDDNVVNFTFDSSVNQTLVNLYQDLDGNGTGDVYKGTISPENVKSLWKAGNILWQRNLADDPRTIYTTVNGSTLISFDSSSSSATTLMPYLQAATLASAQKTINFVTGIDYPGDATMRSRTVSIGGASNVWKLGDIVASTPRIQSKIPLNTYDQSPPTGYNDKTYLSFIGSNQYRNRGMAYAGANDGMLHAFNLGSLDVTAYGSQKATLSGSNLGREQWAFVPRNVLPYLTYLTDPNYSHLYYVDLSSTIADVAIGTPTSCNSSYWDCPKSIAVTTANDLDLTLTGWRSILIGGMGLGGSTSKSATCTNCVKTPMADPADSTKGFGYSSYFALDVTLPESPAMLWEFSSPELGFTTSGPAIVRIGPSGKNGRWLAIFASGPTGPIDTTSHQFLGKSEQNLKLFVIDLKDGTHLYTIDTGIQYAFAGSLQGGAIDADRWNPSSPSNYQDDMVYVGYVARTGSGTQQSPYSWTNGGVLRIGIKKTIDPGSILASDFVVSKVIDGIGPVTTAISRLQDRKNRSLWLYFGTGRYFFKAATEAAFDDCAGQRALYGVKDPCYTVSNTLDQTCTTTVDISTLTNQTTNSSTTLTLNKEQGWYISLDASTGGFCAERDITNPVALTNGAVFFTTFKPSADICNFGGNSYLWATKYDTGYTPSYGSLFGKAIVQMSTGSFEEPQFSSRNDPSSSIFKDRENRRMIPPMQGKPPADPPTIINNSMNRPVKKVLHIQEK